MHDTVLGGTGATWACSVEYRTADTCQDASDSPMLPFLSPGHSTPDFAKWVTTACARAAGGEAAEARQLQQWGDMPKDADMAAIKYERKGQGRVVLSDNNDRCMGCQMFWVVLASEPAKFHPIFSLVRTPPGCPLTLSPGGATLTCAVLSTMFPCNTSCVCHAGH